IAQSVLGTVAGGSSWETVAGAGGLAALAGGAPFIARGGIGPASVGVSGVAGLAGGGGPAGVGGFGPGAALRLSAAVGRQLPRSTSTQPTARQSCWRAVGSHIADAKATERR
ncbi:MAG: hypothetical protein ABJD68_17690, partial [Nakamurella sp.]